MCKGSTNESLKPREPTKLALSSDTLWRPSAGLTKQDFSMSLSRLYIILPVFPSGR